MDTYDRRRLERHARRLEELHLWRNARERRLEEWRFVAGDEVGVASGSEPSDTTPSSKGPRDLKLGDFWPEAALPILLSAEAEVPASWAGEPVEIELWLGGEGFVRLSNGITGGLNPFHRSFRVAEKARGGERVGVEAEVVSKGLWGSRVAEPRLERASLVVPEVGVRALERNLAAVLAACEELGDHDAVAHLLDAVDAALRALDAGWPSGAEAARARYLRGYSEAAGDGLSSLPPNIAGRVRGGVRGMRSLWSVPSAPGELEPLPEEARRAVERARGALAGRLKGIKAEYPPAGRLALCGHAHIDLAWLWPLAETRRKARRTFSSVLGLMDRYEDFTFNQSSAQLYRWIEEDDPELFGRIGERIAEGRWEPVGGSWTEPDCQITGGEAFVRQLFYGQRFFDERFGRRSSVAWLPDVFGFSPGIPQLLRGAGITGFFTAKLKWSETNRFPRDLFAWEGIDGSRVIAHSFRNPGMDYNGDVAPFDVLGVWRNFEGKRRHPESLFTFGWGDGGGGPSEEMLESYDRLKDFPALPRLRMTRVDDFFDGLPQTGLPEWVGELYLELHRGTLTTQGRVKRLNREAEHRLLEAEAFATVAALHGSPYPGEELEAAWKTLLLNQFHDILPGSSVREVYEDAHRQLEETVATAEGLRDGALGRLAAGRESGDTKALLVANASLHPRGVTVLLPGKHPEGAYVVDAADTPLPTQRTQEGLLVHAPHCTVAGIGWTTLRVERGSAGGDPSVAPDVGAREEGKGAVIENGLLRVEVGSDGTLRRICDEEAGREVLAGRANQLWAYVDKPRDWDAWDVEEDYEASGEEIPAGRVEVVERGPLRAAVRVERRWRGSRVTQTYSLLSGSRRLDIFTEVDWREKQVMLRALFPLNIRTNEATFETMYGTLGRPTHRNTSWDAARFEVSAHRFADLSEPGYGVALLNDGKYGHSATGNVLGLSLLRSPLYPDPFADEGHHRFTYSIFPHSGDWTEAGVVREAFALNSPLVTVVGGGSSEYGFVAAEGLELALGSLKKAEGGQGVILRLYEPHGARGEAVLRFSSGVEHAERTDLLEEPGGEVEARGDQIRLDVRPFEVITLRVEAGSG
jgi:alpha-mannosidase